MNTIVAYRHAESLLSPPEQWDALAGGVPFRQTVWMKPWWNQFGTQKETLIVTVLDEDDTLCGILPLQRDGRHGWRTVAGGMVCTDHVSMLARPEDRQVVAEAIADFLIDNAVDPQLGWDHLHFEGTLAGDPAMRCLVAELEQRGASSKLTTRMNTWFIPCRDDWDGYLASCSRRTRRRYRDLVKRLETKPLFSVRTPETEAMVIEAVEKLMELHQRHWVSQGEPGSYARSEMKTFTVATAVAAFRRDRLFLPMLVWSDPESGMEKTIATQLHFIGEDQRWYCFSTAVDYDHSALSPGVLLNAFVLKSAHDQDCSGIDFMRGDELYKEHLGAQSIPLLEIGISAPTLRGRVDSIAREGIFVCKQALRQRLGRPLVRPLTTAEAFDPKYLELLPCPIETHPVENGEDLFIDSEDRPMILPISLGWANAALDAPVRR